MKNLIFLYFSLWIYFFLGFNIIYGLKSDFKNEQLVSADSNVHGRLNRSIDIDADLTNTNKLLHNKDTGTLKLNIIIIVFVSVTGTILLLGTIIFAVYYMHIQKAISIDDSSTSTTKGTKSRGSRRPDRRKK